MEGREAGQARRGLEVRALAPLGGPPVGAPDRPRGRAAEPGGGTREGVPRPDGRRVHRGVAHEPGVREVLTGARLPGLGLAAYGGLAGAAAPGDSSLEPLRPLVALPLGQDPPALPRARLGDLPAGEDDP